MENNKNEVKEIPDPTLTESFYLNTKKSLKSIGEWSLGIVVFLAISMIPFVFIFGATWFAEVILPWLNWISGFVLAINLIIISPLVFWKKTKIGASFWLLSSSYFFGLILWFQGLIITYYFWGFTAVFIGLCIFGGGVVPIALLVLLLHGEWLILFSVIFNIILTFGFRYFGLYLLEENEFTKNTVTKRYFQFLMFILILIMVQILIGYNVAKENNYTSNLLLELEPTIQPLGYFDDPILFNSETITDEDWFSHLVYYEFEEVDSIFDNSRTQFPNQKGVFSSIVKIVCVDDEYFYYGSGTNLDSSGIILTNRHVIEGMGNDSCIVGFPDPESGLIKEAYWATPIFDEDNITGHDLAYLSVEDPVFDEDNNIYGYYERLVEGSFPIFNTPDKCSLTSPQLGDEIFVIGYPPLSGGGLTITNGLISSLYSSDGYLITSAKIVSGNSGGSAIDKEGCFVGVPTAVYYEEESEYLGEIIDASFIGEFIDAISDDYDDYVNSL